MLHLHPQSEGSPFSNPLSRPFYLNSLYVSTSSHRTFPAQRMTQMPIQQEHRDLDLGGSFLQDLPRLIKRYTYHGDSQFFDVFESEFDRFEALTNASEFLLFHASKDTIEAIFDPQNEDTSIARYCTSFDTKEELILVTMSSTPHSAAADVMNTMILHTLQPMGLFFSLQGYAGAKIRGTCRGKAADYGWGPKRRTGGEPDSPSVTLEVAYSQSDFKLNSDVRFWLDPDNGKANICLTFRINRSQPEIRIEKWERQNNRIHRSQVVWIAKKGDRTNVCHHPLVISFESLFRRQSSRPGEKDLEISQRQLEEVAETVWLAQGW